MGSLILFSAHQLALLVPHFERQGSLSGYGYQHHRVRAAGVTFQKHEQDHSPNPSLEWFPTICRIMSNHSSMLLQGHLLFRPHFLPPSFKRSVLFVTGIFNIPEAQEKLSPFMMFPFSFSISPTSYENITHP